MASRTTLEAILLSIQYRPIADLIPYARNSRTHSDEQVNQIAASIKEFSFTNPVLIDETGGIIAGHGRVSAAHKLGLEQVPTITLAHLSPTQRKAYVIADNRLAENSGWDLSMLGLELEELKAEDFDMGLLGFHNEELDKFLNGSPELQFEPDLPPDEGNQQGEQKFQLTVIFENDGQQQDLFTELRDRGFKVKA